MSNSKEDRKKLKDILLKKLYCKVNINFTLIRLLSNPEFSIPK